MIILGIDPGIATTGYGVIQVEKRTLQYIDCGVIKTEKKTLHYKRLMELSNKATRLIKKHHPDYIGIEQLYMYKNVKTAMVVGEARGVLILTVGKLHIPFYEFTPLQIKQALTGYGKATKGQIQKMVQRLLKLRELPKPDDAADGLAVAICLAQNTKIFYASIS